MNIDLKKMVGILFVAAIILGMVLIRMYDGPENTKNYMIYVYDDGTARIEVVNINLVQQQEDGTLIIPGGGKPESYNYTRHGYYRRME